MPDDDTAQDQVAEQEAGTTAVANIDEETTADKLSDEVAAFGQDDDSDDTDELGLDPEKKAAKKSDDASASDEKDKKQAKPKDGESEEGESEKEGGKKADDSENSGDDDDEEELDDDTKRGRELLEAQKAADDKKKEEEAAADTAKNETDEKKSGDDEEFDSKYSIESYTDDHIKQFNGIIPEGLFPKDPVKLDDGTELDFESVVKDYPEIPAMVAGITNHIVREMMGTGFLAGGDHLKSGGNDLMQKIQNMLFVREITHPVYGVPNAKDIVESKEFPKWLEKESDEIKALEKSANPHDRIRLLKRFLNNEVVDKMEEGAAAADDKRKAAKKNFDAVHKSTPKSGKPKSKKAVADTPDDERAAFEEDDKDDLI